MDDTTKLAPRLVAYRLDGLDLRIRPAPVEREWMEQTHERYAYRCLPLNIANAHGWELLCPAGFFARWDGLRGKEAVHVKADLGTHAPAVSHFGHGVLTFHVPCVFRTDPGFDLFVTGPINRPKDAIAPLTGVIETDWASHGFTMNWQFTRANTKVRFERDEPYCHIFPVERGLLERVVPEVRPLSTDPDTEREHRAWSQSRASFNADLTQPGSEARQQRWQKGYFRGITPTGDVAPAEHRSRLRLRTFTEGSDANADTDRKP